MGAAVMPMEAGGMYGECLNRGMELMRLKQLYCLELYLHQLEFLGGNSKLG